MGNLLNLTLILFFLSFSLGEVVRFKIGQAASAGPLDFISALLIGIWWFKYRKSKYNLTKPILLFVAFATLSLVINFGNYTSSQLLISSLYLVRWTFYSLLYFVFVDLGRDKRDFTQKLLILTAVIILVIGFTQYFFYPSLRGLYYLGWDEHYKRLFGSFLDPNFIGIILVLMFNYFFVFRERILKNKKLAVLLLVFILSGIILTFSRGALLMLATSALTYSVVKKDWKIVVSAALGLIVLFVILSPGFYLENTNLLRTASTAHRLETSAQAIKIFEKNPFGVGFDAYRYAREKYGEKDLSLAGLSHSGAGVDNSFVFVLVTTGIAGLISYLFLLYRAFKLGFGKIKNGYGLVLVVSLTGLIVNSLTINSLFYSFVMIWIWMLAGLTESN